MGGAPPRHGGSRGGILTRVLWECPESMSTGHQFSDSLPGFCVLSSRQLIRRWAGGMGQVGGGVGRWEMTGDRTPEPGPQKSKVIVSAISVRAHPPMWRPCPVP